MKVVVGASRWSSTTCFVSSLWSLLNVIFYVQVVARQGVVLDDASVSIIQTQTCIFLVKELTKGSKSIIAQNSVLGLLQSCNESLT